MYTRVAADLERKGDVARTIGIKLRCDDFRTATRDITLTMPAAHTIVSMDEKIKSGTAVKMDFGVSVCVPHPEFECFSISLSGVLSSSSE